MSDTVCKKCDTRKPDDAFPSYHGKRNGRVCRACQSERRRHRRTVPPTPAAIYRESRKTWHCPACGRGDPLVYPAGFHKVLTAESLCKGCYTRAWQQRKKEKLA